MQAIKSRRGTFDSSRHGRNRQSRAFVIILMNWVASMVSWGGDNVTHTPLVLHASFPSASGTHGSTKLAAILGS